MKKMSCKILLMFLMVLLFTIQVTAQQKRIFYQLTVYHYDSKEQEERLDTYLKDALIPALHRLQIKQVGVFKAIDYDTAIKKRIYVLISSNQLSVLADLSLKLSADKQFQVSAAPYNNAVFNNPPYQRMEILLMRAFTMAPQLTRPQLKAKANERVYELRSYESATEKIFQNKVHMFNEGDEIGLFKRLNFNAVFYAEVIAGSKMPNLMYMTCFENMADRDAHWKKFVEDAYWKKLSAMPEYQNNVSHIDILFLRPTDYSDY